jgi:hypothetical protein
MSSITHPCGDDTPIKGAIVVPNGYVDRQARDTWSRTPVTVSLVSELIMELVDVAALDVTCSGGHGQLLSEPGDLRSQ